MAYLDELSTLGESIIAEFYQDRGFAMSSLSPGHFHCNPPRWPTWRAATGRPMRRSSGGSCGERIADQSGTQSCSMRARLCSLPAKRVPCRKDGNQRLSYMIADEPKPS